MPLFRKKSLARVGQGEGRSAQSKAAPIRFLNIEASSLIPGTASGGLSPEHPAESPYFFSHLTSVHTEKCIQARKKQSATIPAITATVP